MPRQAALPKVERRRLWALSRPERGYLLVALLACTFSGTVFPVFSLILSTIITFFYLDDADELQRKASHEKTSKNETKHLRCYILW